MNDEDDIDIWIPATELKKATQLLTLIPSVIKQVFQDSGFGFPYSGLKAIHLISILMNAHCV